MTPARAEIASAQRDFRDPQSRAAAEILVLHAILAKMFK
jgi:hypothetical protein